MKKENRNLKSKEALNSIIFVSIYKHNNLINFVSNWFYLIFKSDLIDYNRN